jgi:hypothetical protein
MGRAARERSLARPTWEQSAAAYFAAIRSVLSPAVPSGQ